MAVMSGMVAGWLSIEEGISKDWVVDLQLQAPGRWKFVVRKWELMEVVPGVEAPSRLELFERRMGPVW